jgi:Pleckstrin homology domain
LNSNRKTWYKKRLRQREHRSQTASFTAVAVNAHQRALTGLEGPSAAARYGFSFPQPLDVEDEGLRGSSAAASDEERSQDDQEDEDGGEASPRAIAPVSADERQLPQIVRVADEDELTAPKTTAVPSKVGFTPLVDSDGADEDGSRRLLGQSPAEASFVTASERVHTESPTSPSNDVAAEEPPISPQVSNLGRGSTGDKTSTTSNVDCSQPESSNLNGDTSPYPGQTSSTTALIPGKDGKTKSNLSVTSPRSLLMPSPAPVEGGEFETPSRVRVGTAGVRFNIAEGVAKGQETFRRKITGVQRRAVSAKDRRTTLQEGAILKMERMLVRVDITTQPVSEEYDENDSMKTETRPLEKWREFIVVIRQSRKDDADFRLQMYTTRVIPEVENDKVKKKPHHEVALNPKMTRVNLYSSLDKTVVIWHSHKKGTRILIMRPRSTAHSVEWYTFLKDCLGWERPSALQINVPDLNVSLRLEKPFEELETARASVEDANDKAALARTMVEEQAIAGKMIRQCIGMLQNNREWANVLENWSKTEKMGLAWKRYDRLEWVHGANERKMYGSMAMQKSHDLELRPKKHHPTYAYGKKGKFYEEPAPVEGFLIRLTSQRGLQQRLGRAFYKKLYFSTHNQFLVFNKPSKVTPPHPPRLPTITGTNVPTTNEIIDSTPTMFGIEPFPVTDGEVSWIKGTSASVHDFDRKAAEESQRNLENLSQCEGNVNLCRVVKVRKMRWGAMPVDDDMDSGSDVDFHQATSDTTRDDGTTKTLDDDRTFELLLDNGLVVRLQAYNETTMKEWIKRLRSLVKYWKLRIAADTNLFKLVRKSNLDSLNIDEEMEAVVGQFARKWEVSRSEASPQLYNMCGISSCRSIAMSGLLYRKARRHASFHRCGVILANGALHIFQASIRKRTGEQVAHTHQQKQSSIDLKDCYIYSGLVTEDDLLYSNRTFDSNNPGRHALPRVYLEDGWTSIDEDTMICFVIWQGLRKSFFRAREEENRGGTRQKLRQVSRLGVPGRSIVFKCRSRAERDHWVMSVGLQIDQLQQGEEVRLESEK